MNQNLISKINGVDIITIEHDGDIYVPVKPICQALGIDFSAQYNKLQSDETLGSTIAIFATVASDKKEREMVCLPLRYIYGWLFTVNPGKVAPEARVAVSRYRRECYDVLYDYFQQKARRATEQAQAEAALLSEKLSIEKSIKEYKAQVRSIDEQLARLQSERLSPQPNLFD